MMEVRRKGRKRLETWQKRKDRLASARYSFPQRLNFLQPKPSVSSPYGDRPPAHPTVSPPVFFITTLEPWTWKSQSTSVRPTFSSPSISAIHTQWSGPSVDSGRENVDDHPIGRRLMVGEQQNVFGSGAFVEQKVYVAVKHHFHARVRFEEKYGQS